MKLPATAAGGAASTSAGREVLIWRFIGASVWHAVFWLFVLAPAWALVAAPSRGLLAAMTAWSSLTTVSAYLFLYALQYSVFFAQHMVMSPQEAAPLHLPQFGIHSRSWAAPILSRVLLRGRRLNDLIGTAALLTSTCLSAAAFIFTYGKLSSSSSSPSLALSSLYGLMLGLVFSMQHLAGCRDVLDYYPLIHRHRWFRLRQRLPTVMVGGVKVAVLALCLLLATRHNLVNGLGGALAAVHAASLCAAGWLLGGAVLEVVFTEPLHPDPATRTGKEGAGAHPPSLQPLVDALSAGNGIMQDLALQQLATVAEAHTTAACVIRSEVWADESGRRLWVPLAGYLLEEVNEVSTILAAALPSVAGDANKAAAAASQAGGPGAGRMAWNMASSALRAASGRPGTGGGPTRAQDLAAWVVRARLQRLSCALRAVSGLAAASRHEDRYGLVLLCDPGLADITSSLLSAVLALQQYSKLTSTATARSAGPVSRAVQALSSAVISPVHSSVSLGSEGCAHVLADEARRCVYKVAAAFGLSLATVLKETVSKPAYGSLADAHALLQGILTYQE